MLDTARSAVDAATKAGADYADARLVTEESESLTVKNQEMEGIDRGRSDGIGIRVLVNGFWGFAATARLDDAEVQRTAELAVAIAKAASRLPRDPIELAQVEPAKARWETAVQVDPFTVPLEEKVALLMEASRRQQQVPGVSFAEASLDFYRRHTSFASSEGAAIEQTLVNSGGGIEAMAIGNGEMQRRSYPNSFRGHLTAAGWEHIGRLGLVEESERIGKEAVDLLNAKDCPSEITTLVLDSGQIAVRLQAIDSGGKLAIDQIFFPRAHT